MSAPMPNPFIIDTPTSAGQSPATAGQAAAPDSDASGVAANHSPARFVPDMNRLYLDMVSMPEPDHTPLFLRKPFKPRPAELKVQPSFLQALIDLGRRD